MDSLVVNFKICLKYITKFIYIYIKNCYFFFFFFFFFIYNYSIYIDEDDKMLSSAYEFIYSYRDTYESSFPEITSQTSINALEKIKQIKELISSGI